MTGCHRWPKSTHYYVDLAYSKPLYNDQAICFFIPFTVLLRSKTPHANDITQSASETAQEADDYLLLNVDGMGTYYVYSN